MQVPGAYHPIPPPQVTARPQRRRRPRGCCCLFWLSLLIGGLLLGLLAAVFLVPWGVRTNVLVLGLDRRPGEGDLVRADAIMVVTSDPGQPYVGLLSIPRDLYLSIPGQGENRINTAHIFGEMDKPGSGPDRTAAAISQNLAVPIHGWVRVDFGGFVRLIDAVGGIEIDVPRPIVDTAYPTEDYGIMTVEIPAGRQQMDGERALQYARTRHSGSDMDRAQRQQAVVQALVRRLVQPLTWPRLPAFLAVFREVVETDLSLLQLTRLGVAAVRVGPDGLERLVIDQEMVMPHTTSAGAAVLLPRWEAIRPQVARLFGLE